MPPLTIAILSTQRAWHGGEMQAALLSAGLRRRGHRVVGLAREGGEFARRMAANKFEVATFSGRGRNPRAVWRLRRHLRRIRPDLLFYNDAHALTAGALASLGMKIPARIACRRVDFPIRSPLRYVRSCDRVACVSSAVAQVCREGGIPQERIRIIHDGVNPRRVRSGNPAQGRKSLKLHHKTPLLLTVAKLTDHKGHTYLLDAMPAVLAHHPEARLVLAGDGELTEPLQAQAAQLGIERSVLFLGFRDDVPDLIAAADVFVMPSHLEGLNTSVIDAMLAARPIVTTTAGGLPDLVGPRGPDDPAVAWLVPPRDPSALAGAITSALASPLQAATLAELARRRAERCFTADHMVESTLALYHEIVECRNRRAA